MPQPEQITPDDAYAARQKQLAIARAMGHDGRTYEEKQEDERLFMKGVADWSDNAIGDAEDWGFKPERWEIGRGLLLHMKMVAARSGSFFMWSVDSAGMKYTLHGIPVREGGERGTIALHARRGSSHETLQRSMRFIEYRE